MNESKFFDTNNSGVISSSGTVVALSTVGQGASESQRIGRSILIESIAVNGEALLPSAAGTSNNTDTIRMITFIDTQPNGALPGVTDVLESASRLSHYNLSNKDRFAIIDDRKFPMNARAADTSPYDTTSQFHFERTFRVYSHFSGTGSTIADVASNSICMLLITKNGFINHEFISRIRFKE